MKRTIWLPNVAVSHFSEATSDYERPEISGNEIGAGAQFSADAVQFGFCVYEGMRAYLDEDRYLVFRARDHHARLARSCAALHLPCPRYEVFLDAIRLAIETNYDAEARCLYLRPIVFAAAGGIMPGQEQAFTYAVLCTEMDLANSDIRVLVDSENLRTVPAFSEVKTATNYTSSALITQDAQRDGYDTVLWLDRDRYVKECTTMNVFLYIDGELMTPSANGILSGVTRKTMIELMKEQGETVVEKDIHIDALVETLEAGALSYMFTTSTALGINKVTAVKHLGREYRIAGNGPAGLEAAIDRHRTVTRDFPIGLSRHRDIANSSYLGAV
jgi:branched-chain amino acid aminotransferase